MEKKIKIALIVLICIIVVVVIILLATGVFALVPNVDRRGPNAPSGQSSVVAQRKDNGKYQVLLTTSSMSGSLRVYDQPYYIMFNPAISTDPSQTVFDSIGEANTFYDSAYVASPPNKQYSTISTNPVNTDYSNTVMTRNDS